MTQRILDGRCNFSFFQMGVFLSVFSKVKARAAQHWKLLESLVAVTKNGQMPAPDQSGFVTAGPKVSSQCYLQTCSTRFDPQDWKWLQCRCRTLESAMHHVSRPLQGKGFPVYGCGKLSFSGFPGPLMGGHKNRTSYRPRGRRKTDENPLDTHVMVFGGPKKV